MSTDQQIPSGKGMWLAGLIVGGLPAAFMLLDGGMKLFKPPFVVEGTMKVGFPEHTIIPLGVVVVVSTLLYILPQTAVLGAILLTGYLGGAVATHVRMDEGWFPILFPVLFGALLWLGLVLRDPRLRALVPWRSV